MNTKLFTGILVLFLLIVPITVSLFAVSPQYSEKRPLYLEPGETGQFKLFLQNMGTNVDKNVKVSMVGGADIAEFIEDDQIYLVPGGMKDIEVNVKVTLPKDAKDGDKFYVNFTLDEVSNGTDGEMVKITTGYGIRIPVITREPEIDDVDIVIMPEKLNPVIYALLGVLIGAILAGVWVGLKKRKKKKKKKN